MTIKKLLAMLLVFGMLLPMVACGEKPAANGDTEEVVDEMALRATDLKVNNLEMPLGVDTTPQFSWIDKSKTIGRAQSA